ncbi:uncharacterized protein [Nothobranchius furzeri]
MLLPALLLLFLVCRTQASHVYGTMMTYYPKNMGADGSISVILRYKLNYLTCPYVDVWTCSGNCGNQTQSFLSAQVDVSSGEWCQREGIMTQLVPNNSPLQLVMSTNIWATNLNGISSRTAVTFVELRTRSDTGKPNTSPQTTIIPVVKAPSNCQTYVDLLAFDPDGDKVRCRYGDDSSSECSPCTPPPILNLSSSCTLSFSPTPSSAEGLYVIQLVMEDFPTQNMVLTQSNCSQEVKTTSSAISKIPVQFVFKVLPAVPSCSDGLYLPRFLPPTPENGAQFNAAVNQSLEITIRAEATQSVITELLFSGPYDVVKITSGSGNFTLRWTPSDISDKEHLPICFVIQASFNSSVYQSELRCVVVGVGTTPPPTPFGFHGIVNTYTVKDFDGNGYPVIRRVKFSFSSCEAFDSYYCGGNCSNRGDIHTVEESVGEWCQKEVNMSWSQTSFNTSSGWWEGEVWIPNMNGISTFKAFNYLELRNRSDIGKPNSSPQTSVLPAVSVPSNCQRNISLLNFDPDGDEVECRCAVGSLSECLTCSPPSILSVSSSCFLSFSPTSSSNEGLYAVQLMVEDFPRQIITLTDSGVQTITLTDSGVLPVLKTPSDPISRSPLQFALNVLPAVPSCSEGLYLPRFMPPTPANGLQIYAIANEQLAIIIRAEATQSVITQLLVSGPFTMVKSSSGSGNVTLTWTPSNSENDESHPVCFVFEASYSGSVYQSEHRCVVVTVIPFGFHGIVNTYTVKDFDGNGYPVIRRVKFSFSSCEAFDSYYCGGNCSNRGDIHTVEESVGEWCQKEVNMSWSQTSFNTSSGWWDGKIWIPNLNGILTFKAFNYLELRNRSDIGKPNSSPQTNVLPAVSVPSNCQRKISLLIFDPDGDEVRCRYADGSMSECLTCSPPFVLNISSSCNLSFSPTSSSNEGPYAVQLMVEDFPRQIITLNDSSGAEVVKTPSDSISSSPLQFALNVLPAVPSCSEGLYLPRFLPPTPQNGLRIYVIVNHLLQITIRTVATKSVITKLLVSGPYNMVKSTSGLGSFTLTWTPSESENYENYPICFVSEASYSGSVYQSEHRCVLVTVIPYHVLYLKMKISTTMSVVKNKEIIEKAVKSEMVRQGMPSVINVHLSGGDLVELSTIAPPNA